MNCPRYRAAEISGITVVAAFFPPLIDAMVLRYGTARPFASPITADPMMSWLQFEKWACLDLDGQKRGPIHS